MRPSTRIGWTCLRLRPVPLGNPRGLFPTTMAGVLTAEELLAQVAKRDAEALGELYDRFAPRLLGMLARILPTRQEAEETLQEAFLRLWSGARNLGPNCGSVAAWLVVTARLAALERLRARRLENPPPGKVSPSGPSSAKSRSGKPAISTFLATMPQTWLPGPEEIARVEERMGLLQKVLNQLPKAQRQALDLAVFEGCSEAEIAQLLGEPLGKVQAGLRAALTFLKHRRRAVAGTWAVNI